MSKKNYIEPSDFFRATLESINQGEVSEELARMFMALSDKYVNHPKFVRYFHLREDLIATGIMACCRAYDKFRPDRNLLTRDGEGEIIDSEAVEWDGKIVDYDHTQHYNPFAFFTSVVHNAIIQVLKKEYNQRNIVNAIRLEEGLDADYGYVEMIKETEDREKEEDLVAGKKFDDDGNLVISDDTDDAEEEEAPAQEVSAGNIVW
jgi:hypothetical protein